MNPCAARRELLSTLADGSLPADDARDLAAHLESCAGCAAYLARLETLAERFVLLAALPAPDLTPRIMAAVLSEARRGSAVGLRWLWSLSAAATIAALVLGGVFLNELVLLADQSNALLAAEQAALNPFSELVSTDGLIESPTDTASVPTDPVSADPVAGASTEQWGPLVAMVFILLASGLALPAMILSWQRVTPRTTAAGVHS